MGQRVRRLQVLRWGPQSADADLLAFVSVYTAVAVYNRINAYQARRAGRHTQSHAGQCQLSALRLTVGLSQSVWRASTASSGTIRPDVWMHFPTVPVPPWLGRAWEAQVTRTEGNP